MSCKWCDGSWLMGMMECDGAWVTSFAAHVPAHVPAVGWKVGVISVAFLTALIMEKMHPWILIFGRRIRSGPQLNEEADGFGQGVTALARAMVLLGVPAMLTRCNRVFLVDSGPTCHGPLLRWRCCCAVFSVGHGENAVDGSRWEELLAAVVDGGFLLPAQMEDGRRYQGCLLDVRWKGLSQKTDAGSWVADAALAGDRTLPAFGMGMYINIELITRQSLNETQERVNTITSTIVTVTPMLRQFVSPMMQQLDFTIADLLRDNMDLSAAMRDLRKNTDRVCLAVGLPSLNVILEEIAENNVHRAHGLPPKPKKVNPYTGSQGYDFKDPPLGNGVKSKKMKAVRKMVIKDGIRRNQKGFSLWHLGYLMKLCPSGGLWVVFKTIILIGMQKGFNRHVIVVDPLL
ncbi:hypothetical protein ACLOJK_040506 [Asimina triloba]